MTNIIETAERYRVRLEVQQESADCNPRDNDNLTNVITPSQQRYVNVDKDGGPLQYGWDYFSTCPDSEEMFIRWARIYYGVTVIEHRPIEGAWSLWYVMPDKAAETTWTPERVIEADIAEYQAWADGEVYGYVIEKSVAWVPKEGQTDDETPDEMTTWEHVDSCWGYVGYQYAEEEAREAFAPYKES